MQSIHNNEKSPFLYSKDDTTYSYHILPNLFLHRNRVSFLLYKQGIRHKKLRTQGLFRDNA